MTLKHLIFFVGSICSVILCSISFFWIFSKSIDSRPYEALYTISKYGIIENPTEWRNILKVSEYGKKINNIDDLNTLIHRANKHSFITKIANNEDIKSLEYVNFPSASKYKHFTVINIPSFYSTNNTYDSQTYALKLSELIESTPNNIVLNIANNYGGLQEPMIIGSSALIPDGTLFYEVNSQGNKYPVCLKNGKLVGGITDTIDSLPPLKKEKKLGKKVAILTNNNTASAAESLLLALKNNPNVKVFGMPTAGFTSANLGRFLTSQNSDDSWWFVYTAGYYELLHPINGQRFFNNQPVSPDYLVEFVMTDKRSQNIVDSSDSQNLFKAINNWFNAH